MKSILKQRLIYFLQISIGLTLVMWLILQVDREKFIDYFTGLSLLNLILILLLGVLSLVLQFHRWRYLIDQYSVSFERKDLLPSFFAGFSFRLIIPGGPAEFSKIFIMSGRKRGKAMAFAMERVFLTFIKVTAILIVLPLTFHAYIVYYVIIFIVTLLIYFLLPRIPLLKELREKDNNYHYVFIINVLFSLGILLIMSLQYYVLLNQVSPISFPATLHTTVYLWSAGIVPISISGLGVREGLAVYFFRYYGIAPAYAVATSLFLFTLNGIIPALAGVFYIYKHRAQFREIKSSLASSREIIGALFKNNQGQGEKRPDQ
jgi:hypothetical protein